MSKYSKYIFIFLVISGFFIRWIGIDWGLPTKTHSLTTYHPDEAFLFQSLENMYKTRSLSPLEIALHYGTFHFYLSGAILLVAKVLGFVTLGSREFMLQNLAQVDRMYLIIRLFSVLAGVLTIVGLYFLVRRLYGEPCALWSSFFLTFSPVAIDVCHFAKVDALLPPLFVWLMYCSFNLLDNPTNKNAWICGIISGIIASTRYNCGIFIVVPFVAIWLNRNPSSVKHSISIILGSILAFFITTPYAILEFRIFVISLDHMLSFITSPDAGQSSRLLGINEILFYLTPFGTSWPMLLLFFVGLIVTFVRKLGNKEKILLAGFISFFILIWSSSTRFTYYIAPTLPIFCIFVSIGLLWLLEKLKIPAAKLALAGLLIIFQVGYSYAYARLYSQPNPRELAGDWLLQNVSPKNSIGIIRSYFWTPGILRQQNPPYTLLTGGNDQSQFYDAILGLQKMDPLPDYFVMSELEMRSLLYFSQDNETYFKTFQSFISNYELVETFENPPSFNGLHFWLRTPPMDLIRIAPTVWIYRKK